MSIGDYTSNFSIPLSNFDTSTWIDEDWARWRLLDALVAAVDGTDVPYVAATGAVNTFVATFAPAITAYTTGLILSFKANNAVTGASTVNVNGLGAKALVLNGSATVTGDIPDEAYVRAIYDGVSFAVIDPKKPVNANQSISTGASGATANASTDFYVESTGPTYIELLSPNASTQGYMFSRPSLSYAGGMKYDHINGTLILRVEGTDVFSITAAGFVTSAKFIGALQGNADTATKLASARTIAFTGNVTGTGTFDGSANYSAALTITADAVTNSMLANVPTQTFKGRTTAATGDLEDLTATQATAMLNAVVGDSGSGGTKGVVPAPAAGDAAATKVLSADGTWKAGVPIGSITMYSKNTAPTGWLECNAAAVSRTTYADLFAVIGTVFGSGDGSTTFNLPEMRGEFARGWDNGRGIDAARAFGSAQADELEAHIHLISPPSANDTTASGLTTTGSGGIESVTPYNSGSTGGTETRPRNIALMFIIKF